MILVSCEDIDDTYRLNVKLSCQETHDALTGLTNQESLVERRISVLDSLHAEPTEDSLAIIDIDQFKIINDTCGHTTGDELCNVAVPSQLLPAAERYKLSEKVDRWVLLNALTWLRDNPNFVEKLHLCGSNLSGQSMGNAAKLKFILEQIDEDSVPAENSVSKSRRPLRSPIFPRQPTSLLNLKIAVACSL